MSVMGGAMGASDRQPVLHATLDELDLEALAAFVEQRLPGRLESGEPLEVLATRLGLLARSGAHSTVPTAAGLLLFGTLPQLMQPHWGVVAARFAGTQVSDPVRERCDLEGNLATLLDGALDFVVRHARGVMDSARGQGEVFDDYPVDGVRELVLNALVHRELRAGGRVALRLFDDRLEIWSPGGPVSGQLDLDVLALEGGVSLPRNVVLAAHARSLGLGEQLGRGLTLARRMLAEHGQRELTIETDAHSVLVVLPAASGAAGEAWVV